ncbi:importin-4-like [Pseudomyrmex gracilis]|uniref:importin-4-like n=1 Tax=Pseudomyrmex gracilis TaxID=219809 RepID=UPI000995BDC5|nr:importin-4-like [Pseudomyrmex gracilis]
MEQLIQKLLLPDNVTILQATAELQQALKDPNSISELCQLLVTSTNLEVRQYAALILRRRYAKQNNWKMLPESIRTEFKKGILQALKNESEKSVRKGIALLIGVIVTHELSTNNWPEVIDYIQQSVTSENLHIMELGVCTLSIMTEIRTNVYASHARSLTVLLAQTLNNLQNLGHPVAYYVLATLKNLVPLIRDDKMMVNTYSTLMPHIMTTIQDLSKSQYEDMAIKSFELLDELCENANAVITPHVKQLINMCLEITIDKSLDEGLRVKAVNFIGWLTKLKKKTIVKHKLIHPIVDVIFSLIASSPQNENEDYINSENNNILTNATLTLDMLALHLPPEKLLPYVMQHIESGLRGVDVYTKRAAYVLMAVLAEGCSEYIRANCLEFFLQGICQGITESSDVVRNAALYALGQFSEHLQPEISHYASDLLPVLFEYLSQVCSYIKQEKKEPPAISRMFYALEQFCENMNDEILPYLHELMSRLLDILTANTCGLTHVTELTLSAIGAAADAAKENMLPYFETIVNILNGYITAEATEDTMCVKIQAVDTFAIIARSIGSQHFAPLAATSLDFGMKLLKTYPDETDLRKALYGLFASISSVMKKDMAPVLPEIVEYLLASIRSSEGIVLHCKDDETVALYNGFSDEEEEEVEEENIEQSDNEEEYDDEEIEGYSVENSYIEEKEESVIALKDIAENTGEAFLPYLQRSFEEIFKLINYPQDDIRKASMEALVQFCINFSKIDNEEGRQSLLKALSVFIPKLSEIIRLDEEPSVATCGLEAYSELLDEIKSIVIMGEGHKDAIINCVIDVFAGKLACQDQDQDEDDNTDAEQDKYLLDYASTVLINIGRLVPPEDFAICFETILPMLLKRLKKSDEWQRSAAVGTIAECMSGLRHLSTAFVSRLLPIFLQGATQDSDNEVRSNCFFAIGELVLYAKEAVFPHYPQILQTLSHAISKETHETARDNVIGALARLIITNYSSLPLEQILPVFVQQLPLNLDWSEHKAVFQSIHTLYQAGVNVLQSYISRLLRIAITILHEEKYNDEETKRLIIEFIQCAQRDFQNDWNKIYSEMRLEVQQLDQDFSRPRFGNNLIT